MPAAKHRHVGNYWSNSNSQTIKCEILEPWHVNLAVFSSHLRRMQRCWGGGILPNDDQTDDSPVFVSLPFYICPMSTAPLYDSGDSVFSSPEEDLTPKDQSRDYYHHGSELTGKAFHISGAREWVRRSLGRSNGWSSSGPAWVLTMNQLTTQTRDLS